MAATDTERRYIAHVLARVQAVAPEKEIIVVDDTSTDGTRELLENIHTGRQEQRPSIVLSDLVEPLRIDNSSVQALLCIAWYGVFASGRRGKLALQTPSALDRSVSRATGKAAFVEPALTSTTYPPHTRTH